MANYFNSMLRAATLALLFSSSSTDAFSFQNLFSSDNNETDLIELDITHHTPKLTRCTRIKRDDNQLMNMNFMFPIQVQNKEPKVLDYIEENLKDFNKIQVMAEILVGSNRQPFNLIFDTGSPWVWVGHEKCLNCANPAHFHSRESSTFHQLTNQMTQLFYGQGAVEGFDTTDQVCLDRQSVLGHGCMNDYLFKSVVQQRQLGGLAGAGLIGLSPTAAGGGAQLFVPSLYKQGAIKRNMFSMFIDKNEHSKIQIGGYNLNKYAKGPLKWYPLATGNFWDVKLGPIMMGDYQINTPAHTVMADTGTSLNMIPDRDYYDIMNTFIAGKTECFMLPNSLQSCSCSQEFHDSMPDIKFALGEDIYTIPATSWFERSPDGQCVVKFMHAPGRDTWILGLNFFEDYYAVFDYANKRIGFAPSINQGLAPSQIMSQKQQDNRQIFQELNEVEKTSPSHESAAFCAFLVVMTFLFGAYVFIIKTNNDVKVASVEAKTEDVKTEVNVECQDLDKNSADSHYAQL